MSEPHAELGCGELEEWRQKGAIIVDVREEFELLSGVIPGSISVPMSELLERLDELGGAPVVLVCASGSRSRRVAEYLCENGFRHAVANLTGGLKGWREEGRELLSWSPAFRE